MTGQKVWTTWGQDADFAILLARTDPSRPKNKGITYFLIDMHQPGVDVRPLRHISGEVEFNEVFLDQARVPDFGASATSTTAGASPARRCRASARWWPAPVRVAAGGSAAPVCDRLLKLARASTAWPATRWCASGWPRCGARSASAPGRTSGWRRTSPPARPRARRRSIGKVHQAGLNQRVQRPRSTSSALDATAWDAGGAVPARQRRLLRVVAVRDQRDAAQPGQHHRGWHHRGEQEHARRARARPAARARRLARQALERDPEACS